MNLKLNNILLLYILPNKLALTENSNAENYDGQNRPAIGVSEWINVRSCRQSGRTDWHWTAVEPVIHGFRDPAERTTGLGDQVLASERLQ